MHSFILIKIQESDSTKTVKVSVHRPVTTMRQMRQLPHQNNEINTKSVSKFEADSGDNNDLPHHKMS